MPSEQVSRRRWIRVACFSARAPLSLLVMLAVLASCPVAYASHPSSDALAATRDALAGLDEFGALLLGAGLPIEAIPQGRSLSPVQAERLRRHFSILPYLPQQYSPRFVAHELLRYVEQHGEEVSRWDLSRMVQAYRSLFLLRQDGYLAAALTGEPSMCVGPVEVRDDGAGAFEMGVFHTRADGDRWRSADSPNLDKL
ncbi:hypothetical protein [Vitiosangium sp. GDMCC 1.1324]|uniref:hypothetical protein n=1 Tax=Vitiosangium sp. (strain GDMCC 1.1324) TaxID=2138576 RepID=UPI000D4D617F|nr:hypothetical protein [Vitiosangium sp. GDMCC 1.1324]PTL75527.1 hypothetical protein DAT35_54720 [Vitiosangium sp. GDMCC 1.1324]